jgi:hypothetical protein
MVFLQATVRLHAGATDKFGTLIKAIAPLLEQYGWVLIGGYTFTTGRQRSVLNLWQAPDANALPELAGHVAQDPALQKLFNELDTCIESEVYDLLEKAPWIP